jgi:hypothetical protein
VALNEYYLAALETLALACTRYHEITNGGEAVLVGGAATALLTGGAFMSADFDLVASADDAFEAAMTELGFIKENRPGVVLRGFYHPNHPDFGFEPVSGRLFDGKSDLNRLVRVRLIGDGSIVVPSIEDMIADRLAQYAVSSPTDDSRLLQATYLFRLAEAPDIAYLYGRITEEGGDPALLGIEKGQQVSS